MADRLDTKLWLEGHLRQFGAQGSSYYISHKGDPARGSVILKLILGRTEGCRLLIQAHSPEGEPGWLPALGGKTVTEDEAQDYINRAISRDPDVWVVELDSTDGTHPFPGKLLG